MKEVINHLEANNTSKIVIYDSSKGFSRFLKSKLEERYEVKIISSKNVLKKYETSEIGILFYIINDGVDAIMFKNLNYDTKKVFLGVASKYLEDRIENYDHVITFDLELTKKDIFEQINKHLQIA